MTRGYQDDIGIVPSSVPSGLPRSLFAWALVDQGLASGTTFIFTIIAARALGPAGLGTVAIGLAGFYVAYGLERSLIVNPFLARDSTSSRSGLEALKSATSLTIAGGFLFGLLAFLVGMAVTGAATRGLLIFAPWFAPALTQDLLKAWLYREGRGAVSAASSAVWLATMLCAMSAGLRSTDWQLVAAWGLGGCAALAAAAVRIDGLGLARPRAAVAWFKEEAVRLGSWLAGAGAYYTIAVYVRLAGISSMLGPAAVGGYRAVETAFAPTSLIGPALSNPGLATLRDSVEHHPEQAWKLAMRISLLASGLAVAYVIVVVLAKELIFIVLGTEFRRYQDLILPIALGQLLASCGTGFSLLLGAARRMRDLALLVILDSTLMVVFSLPLASRYGLEGAAWGVSLAGVPPLILTVVRARSAVRILTGTALGDARITGRRQT